MDVLSLRASLIQSSDQVLDELLEPVPWEKITEDTPIAEIIQIFKRSELDHLRVYNRLGHMIGIVTHESFLRFLLNRETVLYETLDRQARMIDAAPHVIMIRDLKGNVLHWNRGAERLYSWSKEEAVGKNSQELLKTRFSQSEKQIEQKLFNSGYWVGQLNQVNRYSTPVCVESHWTLLRDDKGAPSMILEINYDISVRKETEARYTSIANAFPYFIWVNDTSGPCRFVNRHFLDFTGLTKEEALGDGWKKAVHPEDLQRIWSEWEAAAEKGEACNLVYRFRKAADGCFYWYLGRVIPVHNEHGKITQWIGIAFDIMAAEKLIAKEMPKIEKFSIQETGFSFKKSASSRDRISPTHAN